jgi:hypothetical protein
VCIYLYLSYFRVGLLRVGDIGGTDYTRSILPTTYVTCALFDRKQGSHFDIGTSNLYHILYREAFQFLAPTLHKKLTFGFRQRPQLRKLTMVDSEGPPPHSAAASHQKVSRHHCGRVGCRLLLRIVLCLLCLLRLVSSSLSLFAFQQLRPTCSFFLSIAPFLVDCWLSIGPSIFGVPWCWVSPSFNIREHDIPSLAVNSLHGNIL